MKYEATELTVKTCKKRKALKIVEFGKVTVGSYFYYATYPRCGDETLWLKINDSDAYSLSSEYIIDIDELEPVCVVDNGTLTIEGSVPNEYYTSSEEGHKYMDEHPEDYDNYR